MHEHYYGFTLINMKFTVSESSAKLSLSNAERCELGEANGRFYASFSRLSVPMAVALPFDRLRARAQGAVSADC